VAESRQFQSNQFAFVLGASSGFGEAIALELARRGMSIVGVHFDRAGTMPKVNKIVSGVKAAGVKALFFNINAADAAKRDETLDSVKKEFGSIPGATIRVLVHSLAFGTLKPYIAAKAADSMTQPQVEMTMDVMANSLVYWTQGAFFRGMMTAGASIYAMTSSGGHAVLPNYGAVSAAKAALESHIRQLALEMGPHGIRANSLMAGVTDTPALRKIPGAVNMLEIARRKNPQMRVTTPLDVAKAIALLAQDDAGFISGNVIGVDAGEDMVSYIGQNSPRELE